MSVDHPFEAPTTELQAAGYWQPVLGFLWRRTLRLVAAPLVLLTLGMLIIPHAVTWVLVGSLVLLGVLLYLPSTALIFRTRFLPRDPDLDELLLSDGDRVHAGDYLVTVRAVAAENLIGTLPLGLLALYAVLYTGGVGVLVGLGCAALAVANALRTVVDASVGESTVHLGRERLVQAERPVQLVSRLPLPARMVDPVWHQLAVVRFRAGDIPGMLAALARIRDRQGWSADLLEAQARISLGDLQPAREALEAPEDAEHTDAREALEVLLALHEDRPQDVLVHRDRWEASRAEVTPHQARLRDLWAAAALSGAEPEAARRLLRRGRWRVEQLDWLRRVWPGVGGRISPLIPW